MGMRTFQMNLRWTPQPGWLGRAIVGMFRGEPEPELSIDASILIVANPKAGNGGAIEKAVELHRLLRGGDIPVKGNIRLIRTHRDPSTRREEILTHAREIGVADLETIIIAMGGNTTADNVYEAAGILKSGGMKVAGMAGPGGRIGDHQLRTGVPSDVRELPRFIAQSKRALAYGMEVFRNWSDEPQVTYLSASVEDGSGAMYERLDRKYEEEERVTLWDYLRELVPAIMDSREMLFHVNGERNIRAGGLFAFASNSQGGVADPTTHPDGIRVVFAPAYPRGMVVVAETLARGLLKRVAGLQLYAQPSNGLRTLSHDHQIDISPGQELNAVVSETDGRPAFIRGTIGGEHTDGSYITRLRVMDDPASIVVGEDSDVMVGDGRTFPKFPFDGVTHGAVSSLVQASRIAYGSSQFLAFAVRELGSRALGKRRGQRRHYKTRVAAQLI